ncbi:hypothetical protein [Priestia megaterium]|uniref:hypothetical protein n=1 Tax=Priestia megaterium TaxID=1404 RepID=UPI002FFEAE91
MNEVKAINFAYKMTDDVGRIMLSRRIINGFLLTPNDIFTFGVYKHYIIMVKESENIFLKDFLTDGSQRKLHSIGRVSIPLEIRQQLEIKDHQEMHIQQFDNCIIFNRSIDDGKNSDEDINYILRRLKEASKDEVFVYRQIKDDGKVQLTDGILKAFGFNRQSRVQYFLKENTLVLKEFTFDVKAPEGMTYTGQSRKIDHVVKLDIPKKLKEALNLNIGDCLAFYKKGAMIYVSKLETKNL